LNGKEEVKSLLIVKRIKGIIKEEDKEFNTSN